MSTTTVETDDRGSHAASNPSHGLFVSPHERREGYRASIRGHVLDLADPNNGHALAPTPDDLFGARHPRRDRAHRRVSALMEEATCIGVPFADARVPDIVGISQYGVVYTGKKKKIAEHGGDNPQDRDVPIVVSGNPIENAGNVVGSPVETTQIAPTILQLLGLDPNALQAVQIEHTAALPIG